MSAKFNVIFNSTSDAFEIGFKTNDTAFKTNFSATCEVPYIPKEYGLITYNQDKTITIT